jgi:hypothetical protein
MAALEIDLEWRRDAKGYLLKESRAPKAYAADDETSLLARDWGSPKRIVPKGGNLIFDRPLAKNDHLFLYFAKEGTEPSGLLKFINAFGPLTRSGFDCDRGEEVPRLVSHAAAMRGWIDAVRDERRASLPDSIGPDGLKLGTLVAEVVIDPITQAPRLRLRVNDLLTGLWVQLGQKMTGSARFQRCLQCRGMFETGPGTGRRLDAKFCTDAHRIAFNSQKRSRPGS